ncbi:MAG TPA: response regulator transcription factor [Methylococcaceae bacterium]|nr:response regulator transcription factor [Methylococcaceae bacterium]
MQKNYPILLVEDEVYTRERMIKAVNSHSQLFISDAVGTIHEALEALEKKEQPVIALIDLCLPDGSGLDLIKQLTTKKIPIPCLVITVLADEQHVIAALSAGASGYLLKDSSVDDIGDHILILMNEGSPISPKIARHLLKHFNARSMLPDPELSLTAKEYGVLKLIYQGFKRKEIADSLNISVHTVGSHVKNIYRKLSVNSSIEAVHIALQQGIL